MYLKKEEKSKCFFFFYENNKLNLKGAFFNEREEDDE